MRRRRQITIARMILGIVGAFYVVRALSINWQGIQGLPRPRYDRLGIALLVLAIATILLSKAWVTLSSRSGKRDLHILFLSSLLGKYMPGGLGQPAAQILLGHGDDHAPGILATMFIVHSGAQVVAAGAIGLGALLTVPDLRTWLPIATGAWLLLAWIFLRGGVGGRMLSRRGLAATYDFAVGKWASKRFAAVAWCVISMVSYGLAFVLILQSLGGDVGVKGVAGYVAAWLIGFLAVPFPAGLGVREAVLMLTIPVAPAIVLAAAIVHRAATLLVELILAFVIRL